MFRRRRRHRLLEVPLAMTRKALFALIALAGFAMPAQAQLDPLLFIKDTQPFVLFVLDTSMRMQRDAPSDPRCAPGAANASQCDVTVANASSTYYDPFIYTKTGAAYETSLLGAAPNITSKYRRKYVGLSFRNDATDKATVSRIDTVTDRDSYIDWSTGLAVPTTVAGSYANFEAATRLSIARAAIVRAVMMNQNDAQFGVISMRQKTPANATQGNYANVLNTTLGQSTAAGVSTEVAGGKWKMSVPTVAANNGAQNTAQNPDVLADDDDASLKMLTMLAKDARQAPNVTLPAYMAAGNDGLNGAGAIVDAPIKFMLDDAYAEAARLIHNDSDCTNTVVVLIVGGGEGTTAAGVTAASAAAAASSFLNINIQTNGNHTGASGRRVPIYVIAIAPPQTDVANLKAIATNSGGKYVEITKAMIDAAMARDMFPWSTVGNTDGNGKPLGTLNLLTLDDAGHQVTVPLPVATTTSTPAGGTVGGGTIVVPEMVAAINTAIQHGLADAVDVNTAPTPSLPYGPISEFQVTSPIIGTVNLEGAKDINGSPLANTIIYDKAVPTPNKIPQRSNVMLTTALVAPGFTGQLRAFRQYIPVADATQPSGYKFRSDNAAGVWERRLWIAKVPTNPDGTVNAGVRNLYTATTDGTIIPFNTNDSNNLQTIATMMGLSGAQATADATSIINFVRGLPFGPVVSSTPAVMNPPSLDPPPDDDYPAFAAANKDRRSIIWVGTNYGVLEGLDARLGVEVWGFIPPTLLPKLRSLRLGQGVTDFAYFVDGSPKVADVKIDGVWRTHLVIGQGDGGSYYQSFDVTLPGMSTLVPPTSDNVTDVLNFFSASTRVSLNWAFPKYSDFDPTLAVWDNEMNSYRPWGDLKPTAPAASKTVGHTWSDPAIGQVQGFNGPFTVLVGSGFMPYTTQQQANRGGTIAGTTFYLLNAKDGTVYDTKDVGNDGRNENIDDCSEDEAPSHGFGWFKHHLGKKKKWFGCNYLKNALQSDPVATGPADSRFISMAYMGDLDGNVWRFDIGLDGSNKPKVNKLTKLWQSGLDQPIFASMATLNVGNTSQYVFYSTGSDLLPSTDVNTKYHLLGLLDNGNSGTVTFDQALDKVNDRSKDEKVTSFPAVAGDIVFFTTTDFRPSNACKDSLAKLWAFNYIGGPAYDSNGDNKVDNKDTAVIASVTGQRATAPFIVDQHLVFGTSATVKMFGDSSDYNNGIGNAGVRMLSWREVR